MTDPDALSNHISTAQLTLAGTRFESLPGPAPAEPWESLTTNRFLLSLKAFSLISQAFRSEANRSALEQAEPNVEVDLHYAIYEDGVRIPGVEVRNQSDSVLGVYQVRIIEFKVAPGGTTLQFGDHQQFFEERDRYILPNATNVFYFNDIEDRFPTDSRLYIQLQTSTVEYERMYRWPAWDLDVATGQAAPAEPRLYDTH